MTLNTEVKKQIKKLTPNRLSNDWSATVLLSDFSILMFTLVSYAQKKNGNDENEPTLVKFTHVVSNFLTRLSAYLVKFPEAKHLVIVTDKGTPAAKLQQSQARGKKVKDKDRYKENENIKFDLNPNIDPDRSLLKNGEPIPIEYKKVMNTRGLKSQFIFLVLRAVMKRLSESSEKGTFKNLVKKFTQEEFIIEFDYKDLYAFSNPCCLFGIKLKQTAVEKSKATYHGISNRLLEADSAIFFHANRFPHEKVAVITNDGDNFALSLLYTASFPKRPLFWVCSIGSKLKKKESKDSKTEMEVEELEEEEEEEETDMKTSKKKKSENKPEMWSIQACVEDLKESKISIYRIVLLSILSGNDYFMKEEGVNNEGVVEWKYPFKGIGPLYISAALEYMEKRWLLLQIPKSLSAFQALVKMIFICKSKNKKSLDLNDRKRDYSERDLDEALDKLNHTKSGAEKAVQIEMPSIDEIVKAFTRLRIALNEWGVSDFN